MEIEDRTHINAPQDRVWQATVDVENWPKWSPAMEKIRREDHGEFKSGSTALIKQTLMPETRWTVTEITPGHSFTWQTRVLGIDMLATHILDPGNGSVISVLRVQMQGLPINLFGPILKLLVSKSLKEENQGLKQYCETGEGIR